MTSKRIFVGGYPRCGSTYLYNILKQHKDITVSEEKEPQRFNLYPFGFYPKLKTFNKNFFWSKKKYENLFENKKIKMDFSVFSIYDKNSAKRIKKEYAYCSRSL